MLTEALGKEPRYGGAINLDGLVPRIAEDIREAGYQWVRVPESYPEGTVTWVYVGGPDGDEPVLVEVKARSNPYTYRSNPDKSTDPTIVEYAVRIMHRGKTPKQAAAATKKKLHGFENLLLGGDVVEIDEDVLEEALYGRILEQARYGLSRGWTPEDSVRSALQSVFYVGFDDKTLALVDKVGREALRRLK